MIPKTRAWLTIGAVLVLSLGAYGARARDAAFLDPGLSASGANDEAVRVEPKGDIDTGESVLNVARRTTIFFVNQTNQPVQVENVAVNNDGNVNAEISNNDCSKQGSIPAQSRCSVEVSVTPSTPGTWSVNVLMTHNGAGRIARSKLMGKTSGSTTASERKDTGLALSSKENAPVTFGDVEVGAKAVRSALMINDSPDTISIYSIDVIEADNGLQRLDQGCAVDMELKPGESCPVTLLWTPTSGGQISTDLIIRHSGRLGFAVIPIRGTAKGESGASANKDNGKTLTDASSAKSLPPPPSAQDLEKAARIPQISSDVLKSAVTPEANIRLIGTVGTRAVFLNGDGSTAVANVGDTFDSGDKSVKLVSLTAKSANLLIDGKHRELVLGAAPELTAKQRNKDGGETQAASNNASGGSGSGSNSGSTLGSPLGNSNNTTPPPITTLAPPAVSSPGAAK